jgi:hypothetical protein
VLHFNALPDHIAPNEARSLRSHFKKSSQFTAGLSQLASCHPAFVASCQLIGEQLPGYSLQTLESANAAI